MKSRDDDQMRREEPGEAGLPVRVAFGLTVLFCMVGLALVWAGQGRGGGLLLIMGAVAFATGMILKNATSTGGAGKNRPAAFMPGTFTAGDGDRSSSGGGSGGDGGGFGGGDGGGGGG